MALTQLPPDIFWPLFGFLGLTASEGLASSCRKALEIARRLYGPRQELGSLVLSPSQRHLAAQAREVPEGGTCVLRAPPGFGKTATALAVAFSAQGRAAPGLRWAVFVPPKALATWHAEIAKVFGSAMFGRPGGVLFLHSAYPKHNARFPVVQGTAAEPALVVTTWPTAARQATVGRILAWANRFVVDEAHTAPSGLLTQLAGRRRGALLLSANRVLFPRDLPAPGWTIGGTSAEWLGGRCPELVLRYALVPPLDGEEAAFARSTERQGRIAQNAAAYCAEVAAVLQPLRRAQVALFLPDGKAGDSLATLLRPSLRAGAWTVVPFVRAVSKIQTFEASPRAVLFVRHSQSEAVNICASHAVVVRPDWVNPARYGQILGRVLRPTNPNPRVVTTLVLPRGVALHRVAYYNAVRDPGAAEDWWPLPRKNFHGPAYERPDAADLRKAACALGACGGRMIDASAPEIAAALGAGIEGGRACAERVLAAWRKAPAVLGEAEVRALLDLAPAPAPARAGSANPGPAEVREPPGLAAPAPAGAGAPVRPPAAESSPAPRPGDPDPAAPVSPASAAELTEALLAELLAELS
jgi:superfamily II DNA or RNA helicase